MVAGRIIELCDILLPVLCKLEGESKAVSILKVSKIAAQVKLSQDGNEEVSIMKIISTTKL